MQSLVRPIPARSDGAVSPSRRRSRRFTGECPVTATQKMIICPYPFCNARVWLGRLVDPSSGDRCEGKEGVYGGRLAPLQPGMCAGSGLPMRGAKVVRKRSVTNPGDQAGTAGAVSGRPADGAGPVPRAGGIAAGAVGGRDAASMGPQPVIGPAASGGQTPVIVAQPQAGSPPAAGLVGTTHPHP